MKHVLSVQAEYKSLAPTPIDGTHRTSYEQRTVFGQKFQNLLVVKQREGCEAVTLCEVVGEPIQNIRLWDPEQIYCRNFV